MAGHFGSWRQLAPQLGDFERAPVDLTMRQGTDIISTSLPQTMAPSGAPSSLVEPRREVNVFEAPPPGGVEDGLFSDLNKPSTAITATVVVLGLGLAAYYLLR